MSQQSVNSINIPSIQNKIPVNFQQNVVPAMQGTIPTSQDEFVQSAQNSYLANRAKASADENSLATFAILPAVWYGITQAADKINSKFNGKYEDSLAGKASDIGDKFTQKTWVGRKIDSGLNWISTKFDKWAGKSQFAYTLKHHSTSPEWSFAKMPGKGLVGFLAGDLDQNLDELFKPIGRNAQKLEQYGLSQDEITQFSKSLNGKSKEVQELLLQEKELKALGVDSAKIKSAKSVGLEEMQKLAKDTKAQAFGMKDFAHYEKDFKGKFIDMPEKTLQMIEKAEKSNIKRISVWRNNAPIDSNGVVTGLNKTKSHLFGRTIGIEELRNKWTLALGKGGKTRLGRAMSKTLGWFTEGTTNRFAGGKLAALMQAYIFADMLVHTYNAPKGEKIKTFAERFVNDFTYIY